MWEEAELWKYQSWMLYHDNAPVHSSLLFYKYLVNMTQRPILPSFLRMAQKLFGPSILLFFFSKLKTILKERRLQSIRETEEIMMSSPNAFHDTFGK